MLPYKPYKERVPDAQYLRLLRKIDREGVVTQSQQDQDAKTYMVPRPMHFKIANGFPMITARNMNPDIEPMTIWRQAIGEIIGFINGARTQEQLESFGCYWWRSWVTEAKCAKRGLETGDLGPGSYGAAFHDFPTSEGSPWNQFKEIVEQMNEFPHLRTHFISPWIPQYIIRGTGKQQKVVVAPCHGWIHFRIIRGNLYLHLLQRSGDVVVGVPNNIIQYAALLLMVAQVTGTVPFEFIHTISDAHYFVDQEFAIQRMLTREARPLPTLTVNPKIRNLFDFRVEDFNLSDYYPYPGIKGIPVAI